MAARIGDIPEIVGEGGILVAPDDPRKLGDALGYLADDESKRSWLAREGRAHALVHDWGSAARNLGHGLEPLL